MKPVLIAILLILGTPLEARESRVAVPFVGCPSDGQQGPQAAPTSGKSPRLSARAAAKLAYYSTFDAGVLAPRGWHCIGLYGSSAESLIVTPERHNAEEFFQDNAIIRGPVVHWSHSFGGTSGRFIVVPAIARYFPRYLPFVLEMKKLNADLDFGPLPAGPRKGDAISRRTSDYVRFTTPAGRRGEGTHSWLVPGDLPIEGSRKIVGPPDEPDLVSADTRLPRSLSGLAEVILSHIK
jgi:hypothetical protein